MNSGIYEHLEVFVAIAHARSLTGASIALGMAQATVSRQLSALEAHVGTALFRRSTRAISLTSAGEKLLQQAPQVLDAMRQAQDAVRAEHGALGGKLRVSCSNAFARLVLIPALPDWYAQHAQSTIDLRLSDEHAPLVEQSLDVAIRMGTLPASNLVAKRLADVPRVCVASHAYLKGRPRIRTPEDLLEHQCLVLTGASRSHTWAFSEGKHTLHVAVNGRLMLSSMDAIRDAVLNGLGIAITPTWFWPHSPEIRKIQTVLPDHALPSQRISAVTTNRPQKGSEMARFIDWVQHVLNDTPHIGRHPEMNTISQAPVGR